MGLNTHYLSTDRGIVKVLQVLLGFVVCSVLCANWYGGASCFGEGRIGYTSGLNFVALIVNIVIFLISMCDVGISKAEHFYNMIMTVLFVIATILFLWFVIEYAAWSFWMIITGIILIVFVVLYSFDITAARHQHQDHIPI